MPTSRCFVHHPGFWYSLSVILRCPSFSSLQWCAYSNISSSFFLFWFQIKARSRLKPSTGKNCGASVGGVIKHWGSSRLSCPFVFTVVAFMCWLCSGSIVKFLFCIRGLEATLYQGEVRILIIKLNHEFWANILISSREKYCVCLCKKLLYFIFVIFKYHYSYNDMATWKDLSFYLFWGYVVHMMQLRLLSVSYKKKWNKRKCVPLRQRGCAYTA